MEIKHKIWLEQDGKVIFGKGRDVLLKAIDECRSLNAAAKKLNMSYRAAWGRLRASEERMGIKLVETDRSGKGMYLTDSARRLVALFDETDKKISRLLEKAHKELQPHTAVKSRDHSSPDS